MACVQLPSTENLSVQLQSVLKDGGLLAVLLLDGQTEPRLKVSLHELHVVPLPEIAETRAFVPRVESFAQDGCLLVLLGYNLELLVLLGQVDHVKPHLKHLAHNCNFFPIKVSLMLKFNRFLDISEHDKLIECPLEHVHLHLIVTLPELTLKHIRLWKDHSWLGSVGTLE